MSCPRLPTLRLSTVRSPTSCVIQVCTAPGVVTCRRYQSSALLDRRWPTYSHHDGVIDRGPRVAGAGTPHHVVTRLGKVGTAVAELDEKVAADEDHQCRAPIVRRPLFAFSPAA